MTQRWQISGRTWWYCEIKDYVVCCMEDVVTEWSRCKPTPVIFKLSVSETNLDTFLSTDGLVYRDWVVRAWAWNFWGWIFEYNIRYGARRAEVEAVESDLENMLVACCSSEANITYWRKNKSHGCICNVLHFKDSSSITRLRMPEPSTLKRCINTRRSV